MSLNNISREKAGNNTTPIRQTRSQKRLEARLAPQQKAAAAVSQMVCVSYNTIAIVTPEGRVVTHGMR